MPSAIEATVTWIKVEKPTFDLVGVVLGAFGIAGVCAAVALVLGTALGAALIYRTRHRESAPGPVVLQLR